jgi:hypothetical protein
MKLRTTALVILIVVVMLFGVSCATTSTYRDQNMDFGSVRSVAVLPFENLSRDNLAGERVRDVFSTMLQATGGVYVVPQGEVARGLSRASISDTSQPSPEEIIKLAGIIKVDAVITGVVREYGEVRSANSTANVVSVSMQMIETQTGRVVWSASSTKGGISFWDRLLGGGGRPMNTVTEEACNDLINKLFE